MGIFKNEKFGEVRTVLMDGEPWFGGKDVAEALGYKNPRDAVGKHVEQEDKAGVAIHDGRQNREMTVINESGLYCLVFASDLITAKEFKHWITHDVIPSIRKHGAYMTETTLESCLNNPDFVIGLLTAT